MLDTFKVTYNDVIQAMNQANSGSFCSPVLIAKILQNFDSPEISDPEHEESNKSHSKMINRDMKNRI